MRGHGPRGIGSREKNWPSGRVAEGPGGRPVPGPVARRFTLGIRSVRRRLRRGCVGIHEAPPVATRTPCRRGGMRVFVRIHAEKIKREGQAQGEGEEIGRQIVAGVRRSGTGTSVLSCQQSAVRVAPRVAWRGSDPARASRPERRTESSEMETGKFQWSRALSLESWQRSKTQGSGLRTQNSGTQNSGTQNSTARSQAP